MVGVEAEGWIDDKLKVARQENFKNVKDMQEKMKSLKKHQAFEAEIMANADRIKAIKTVCSTPLPLSIPSSVALNACSPTANWGAKNVLAAFCS